MFELPELFGSPYVLPAIIVVVVLLLLLLLLSMSRRRRGRVGKAGKERPSATGPATVRTEASGRGVSEGTVRTAAVPGGSMGAAIPSGTDPVAAVIADILQGWGDITVEDTNRLKLFRADKVIAAVAAAEVPKDLKGSEHARTRLNQLRHYASTLRPAPAADAAVAPVGEGETSGEERAAEASWGVEKVQLVAEASDTGPSAPDAASAAKRSWYGALLPEDGTAEAGGAGVEKGPDSAESSEDVEGAQPVAEQASELVEVFSEEQPELVEETVPEIVEEELPAVDEAAELDEAADADSFFSDMGVVSTAEQLLALPSDEQAGMLPFLSPGELGKVFQQAGDPALKKAVIDTLEHVGSTTALDVIHDCLDDPDPEIQVYALDAADRLLGVDQ